MINEGVEDGSKIRDTKTGRHINHCSGCLKSDVGVDADGYTDCCNKHECYGGVQCDCDKHESLARCGECGYFHSVTDCHQGFKS